MKNLYPYIRRSLYRGILVGLILSLPFTFAANAELAPTFIAKWGSRGAGDGQFRYPWGVAIDSADNVYVADTYNNRIQKFDSDGTFLTQWGWWGTGDGQFRCPAGVVLDRGDNVYVVDTGNNRIQKFHSDGTFLAKWGSYGTGDGQFRYPWGVAIDSADNVYVADTSNNRIQKFDSDGTFLTQWGWWGTGDGQFDYPMGVAADSTDNVYVVDTGNHRIQKFHSDGTLLAKWGSYGTGDGQFDYPSCVAIDSANNVYVVDNRNNRIQKFSPSSIRAEIDITPGSNPNSINPKSKGKIPVAILTTDILDATTIDPLSIEFGPDSATETHRRGHIEDVDNDGDLDLVLHFNMQDTGIQCGETSASLTGNTFGGVKIEGSDSIETKGCK